MITENSTKKDDRRFQIFIGSTFENLWEERKKAIEVVVDKGHIPIALERFSASNESDLEVIKKAIRDCQVYLLILGHRYGEIVRGEEISYTELEYNIAKENGLLILPFVLKEKEITEKRKKLDSNVIKDKAELANYDKLCKFHERIKQLFYQPWGQQDEFKFLVEKALNNQLCKCKMRGLIWEPDEPTRTLLQSASRNEFIVDVVKQLSSFGKLDFRVSEQEPKKKRVLASYFCEQYKDRILTHNVSLFFESGSTVAYVARELSEGLSKNIRIEHDGRPSIEVSTNNILVYLQLWLNAKVPCTLFPWGPPEDTYGASFGSLAGKSSLSPDYKLPSLDDVATEEINNLLKAPYTLSTLHAPTLLLGATSGLQMGEEHKIRFKTDDEERLTDKEKEEMREQIKKCFGPHVGSYHNKVFKRFMYTTEIPLMIFITGDKIDCEIVVGKCHFILDTLFTWDQFYKDYPLAFCVGCTWSERLKYIDMFSNLGFELYKEPPFSAVTAFIVRNKKFIANFERLTPMK